MDSVSGVYVLLVSESEAAPRFGATLAAAVYELFSESAVILAIFGFFFSIPCFYFIVTKPPHASAARFALLTYNLTCLYWWVIHSIDLNNTDAMIVSMSDKAETCPLFMLHIIELSP